MHSRLQDMPLRSLASFLEANYNGINAVPKHLWMVRDREAHHEERMHVLGNVVVPACASLAAEVLRNLVIGDDQ